RRATSRILAYVCGPVTPFATVELTVYPYECDAFGHLNQAALLTLLERARWDALARGPGMDLFDRNGVWPAVRKAVVEYKAAVLSRDVLRIETVVTNRGTTSITLRHAVRRVADDVVVAEAEIVFVCIDRVGRATPIPEEIVRFLGPRPSSGHAPIRVPAGDVELGVELRGEGPPVLFVHGFPFDRTMWRHQLATLSRVKRIAPDLRGVGTSGAPASDGYTLARYADDLVPGLVGALHTLRDRPDSTATLRAVRVPTLIVVGEDDAVSPPAAAQAMAALIPGAQCHVIPAAGHLAPLEQPLATGRLLADFLG